MRALHILAAAMLLVGPACIGSSSIDPATGQPVNPGGMPDGGDAPTLRLDSISPAAGPTIGGTELMLTGEGFTAETLVLLDGQFAGPASGDAIVLDPKHILVATPPRDEPGPVDVIVGIPDGAAAVAPAGFSYEERLWIGEADEREDGSSLHPFASIGAALGRAPDGYTLSIQPGTYEEALVLVDRQDLALVGAGPEPSVLRAPSGDEATVGMARSTGIVLEGLSLTGGESGLRLEGASQAQASALSVRGNGTGISIGSGARLALEASEVLENETTGIFVVDGTLEASGNRIEGNAAHGVAVVLSGDAPPTEIALDGNSMLRNGETGLTAVITHDADRVTLMDNRVIQNGRESPSPGIALIAPGTTHEERVFLLSGNEVRANAGPGVVVSAGAWARIGAPDAPNAFAQNRDYGISCARDARVACVSGENDFEGDPRARVDRACPGSCKP